jgi:transposase
MGIRRTEEFRSEAVRIALTSGLSHKQVADDLGIGLSTLGKWISGYKHTELMSGPHNDKDKELARLRKENRILREERDILKKATAFFASQSR